MPPCRPRGADGLGPAESYSLNLTMVLATKSTAAAGRICLGDSMPLARLVRWPSLIAVLGPPPEWLFLLWNTQLTRQATALYSTSNALPFCLVSALVIHPSHVISLLSQAWSGQY